MEDIGGLQKYLDGLPETERALRHQGFTALIQGEECTIPTLRKQLALGEHEIRQTLAVMEKRGTLVWDHERDSLAATGGLSLHPTRHSLHTNGQDLFAWCAVDAVGIPAALSMDAVIHSSCHACDRPVSVQIDQGHLRGSDPTDLMVWVVAGDPSQSVSGHT